MRLVERIRGSASRMARLIQDILAYSRVDRRDLTRQHVDPRDLAESIVAEFGEDVRRGQIEVMMDLPDQPLYVDREALEQVLRNLIGNAVRFVSAAASPRVEIGGAVRDRHLLIWVRDNGIGFEMKYHDRIFEVFQRLHTPDEFPGTGIGLAIVRRAVERMGGRVWANSAPGAGATFFVELPI